MMLFIGIRWQLDFPRKCLKYTDQYSPGLDIVDPIPHKVQFNGTLGFPSPFTGKPSQEIDDAWAEHDTVIEKTRFLTVTADELRDMGWDPADGVKVPEEYGGGYMAYPEVTHMLHCVNFLRMATFPEYYNINTKASIEWDEKDPRIIRPHLDHCAEMLRQSISCKADVTLMTYNRVKGYPKPLPDFSTRHKCRNLPSVLDWLKSRAIPAPPPEYAFPYAPDSRLFSKSPQPDVYLKMHPDAKTEYGRPVAEIVEI
ncbi:hypothetical protein P280DRAFT_473412 [Massarina eburnea CBS 473.64]|uniref:Cyclochlorotine biosynthesis protein O n=1 Tax=Massarina eburnea CBS 473.64 TaxID=1395130 RepID=A0A6A6RPP1_9PLEO|nr:hypothetical protein P280DRAFT_473412 [Massarina eburnea CBS 473.64]